MPIHDFARLKLVVRLSPTGQISMSFKPRESEDNYEPFKDTPTLDSSLHFEGTVVNGASELAVYMSSNNPPCGQKNPRTTGSSDGWLWKQKFTELVDDTFVQSPPTAQLMACFRMCPQTIRGWTPIGRRISSKIKPSKLALRIVICSTNSWAQSRRRRRRMTSKHTASPFVAERCAPFELSQ
jgi:hypothetical protein